MTYTSEQIAACYPEAYAFTRQFEGGYVDDPDDPGGCTNMGITIGTLRDWRNDSTVTCADVQALTEDEAAQIYAQNYWEPVWGDKLPVGVNTQVWDWGVNSGPSRSVAALQRMVDSNPDGVMGPNTLKSVEAYIDRVGIEEALHEYSSIRQEFYESLSTFGKYGNGWTRRNNECLALSLQLAADQPVAPDVGGGDSDDDLEQRVARLEAWARSFAGDV